MDQLDSILEVVFKILPTFIKLFPTIALLLILVFQVLMGYLRGGRKSIILFINMSIALVVSLIIYVSFNTSLKGSLFDQVIGMIPGYEGYTGGLSGLVTGESSFDISTKSEDIILAYIAMILNIVVLIILQFIVYPCVKIIGRIVYFAAFRRKVVEDKQNGKLKRGSGALVGLARGLILGFLIFSQFSTMSFIVTGGVFYTQDEYDELDLDFSFIPLEELGVDSNYVNLLYGAFKTSRSTGLEVIFEKIKIGGTSIDYLFLDFILSGSYTNFEDEKVKLALREELGLTIGIMQRLFDSGVVSYDGYEFNYNIDKITDEVIEGIFGDLSSIQSITQTFPTFLIDMIEQNLVDGKFEIEDGVFITIDLEILKNLDLENDIEQVGVICKLIANLIDVQNFTSFDNVDFYNLDSDDVDAIIRAVSNITLLTDVLLPLGVSVATEAVEDLVFNLDSIIWNEEIQNLEGLYGLLQSLELDKGFDSGFEDLEFLFDDAEKVEVIDKIIKQIFDSELIYRISVAGMEMFLSELSDDDDFVNDLDIDFSLYSKELLKQDVSLLLNTVVGGYSLYTQMTDDDFLSSDIYTMDITPIREMLLGKEATSDTEATKGIMDLNLILCLNEHTLYSSLFENMLGDLIEIPSDLAWKYEIGNLFDVVQTIQNSDIDFESLMSGDIAALSSMSDDTIDELKSSMISSFFVTAIFVSTLTGEDSGLGFLEIPLGIDWYGDENEIGEIENLLSAVFHVLKMDLIDSFTDGDITSILSAISEEDLDILLSSEVLVATISVQLEGLDGGFLILDAAIEDGNGYITKEEILIVYGIIIDNEIDDISNININTIEILSDSNIEAFTSSLIMSRTLVSELKLLSDNGDIISIPEQLSDDEWYKDDGELYKVLTALQVMFGKEATLNDINDFDLSNILDNSEIILDSIVLSLTISNVLSDVSVLEIPNSVKEEKYGSEFIKSSELNNLFNSINELDVANYEDIDLSNIFGSGVNYDTVFSSTIICATFTKNINNVESIQVPNSALSNNVITKDELVSLFTTLRTLGLSDIDSGFSMDSFFGEDTSKEYYSSIFASNIIRATFTYEIGASLDVPSAAKDSEGNITQDEFANLFVALNELGMSNFDNNSGIDIDNIFGDIDYDNIFASIIITATTSNELVKVGELSIPESCKVDGYITKEEMILLFDGLSSLGVNSVTNLDITSILNNSSTLDTALDSMILHATFSDTLLDSYLVVPATYYSNADTQYDVIVDGLIKKEEIINLFSALNVLGLTDFSEVNNLGLNGLTEEKIAAILSSSIISAQMSSEVAKDNRVILIISFKEVQDQNGSVISIIDKETLKTALDLLKN